MILTAKALLTKTPAPTEEEIRTALAGNVCRCTGYLPIIRAVRDAAERMRESAPDSSSSLPARPSRARVLKRRTGKREIAAPRSLSEVLSLAGEIRGQKKLSFVAGGTDWMVRRTGNGENGKDRAALPVDLSGVGELKGISVLPGEIRVGAM